MDRDPSAAVLVDFFVKTFGALTQGLGGTNSPYLPKLAVGYLQNTSSDSSSRSPRVFRSSLLWESSRAAGNQSCPLCTLCGCSFS